MAITECEIRRMTIGRNNLHVILCDDDPAFLEGLQSELNRVFSKLNLSSSTAVFRSPGAVVPERLTDCDMVFLDIDFEGEECNGIDVARKLRQVNRRALIFFVTNYIDYAPAGYEVQAFRYILKRDLSEVLERYILQAMERLAEGQECLHLQSKDEIVDIPLQQISYLEVMDHSVSIHTGERSYELNATLSGLEERLDAHGFLRVHKSFLVNMAHIRKFRSRECLLLDGTALSVSEKNYARQKQKYLLWKGLK